MGDKVKCVTGKNGTVYYYSNGKRIPESKVNFDKLPSEGCPQSGTSKSKKVRFMSPKHFIKKVAEIKKSQKDKILKSQKRVTELVNKTKELESMCDIHQDKMKGLLKADTPVPSKVNGVDWKFKLSSEIELLRKENIRLQSATEELASQKGLIELNLEEITQEKKRLEGLLLTNETTDLHQKIKTLEKDKSELEELLEKSTSAKLKAASDIKILSDKIVSSGEKASKWETSAKTAMSHSIRLRTEIEKAMKEIEGCKTSRPDLEIKKIQDQIENEKKENFELRQRFETLKKERDAHSVVHLNKQIDELKNQLITEEASKKELSLLLQKSKETIKELTVKNEFPRHSDLDEIKNLKDEISVLKETLPGCTEEKEIALIHSEGKILYDITSHIDKKYFSDSKSKQFLLDNLLVPLKKLRPIVLEKIRDNSNDSFYRDISALIAFYGYGLGECGIVLYNVAKEQIPIYPFYDDSILNMGMGDVCGFQSMYNRIQRKFEIFKTLETLTSEEQETFKYIESLSRKFKYFDNPKRELDEIYKILYKLSPYQTSAVEDLPFTVSPHQPASVFRRMSDTALGMVFKSNLTSSEKVFVRLRSAAFWYIYSIKVEGNYDANLVVREGCFDMFDLAINQNPIYPFYERSRDVVRKIFTSESLDSALNIVNQELDRDKFYEKPGWFTSLIGIGKFNQDQEIKETEKYYVAIRECLIKLLY